MSVVESVMSRDISKANGHTINVDPVAVNAGSWCHTFTKPGVHPFDEIEWKIVDASIVGSGGKKVFEAKNIEVPGWWETNTINIVADKYFRVINGQRETSVKQVFARVASTIRKWADEQGYFNSKDDAHVYEMELIYALLHQYGAFNSPVWFNLGIPGRRQAASACFISSVDDTLDSIMEFQKAESVIFAGGSGSGANLSKIRSSYEKLASGSYTSGPLSWMRGLDQYAMAMKSGGSCLAPYQKVYTSNGPIPVKELADSRSEFVVLSWDPPANRYKAKKATAWHAGTKEVIRINTDKGSFDFSIDHPFKLSTGKFVRADELKVGMSLFSCAINKNSSGYLCVNLKDGQKGKELLHRMVAKDVSGSDTYRMRVHHKDGNKYNNAPDNLECMTDSEHVTEHSKKLVEDGDHTFQTRKFPKIGSSNPMYRDSQFWKDAARVESYRKSKSDQLTGSGLAKEMQKLDASEKMLKTGYEIINSGGDVSSFEAFAKSRKTIVGKFASKKRLLESINNRFGSYGNYVNELSINNHRIVSIESVGTMDVYDVNVQCPTEDDKSVNTGHNFVVWSGDDLVGSGVVVANTRNAAKMVILDMDHPDIIETKDGRPGFVRCKAEEEILAHKLVGVGISAAYDDPNGAYKRVMFQNANHSVSIPDAFMQAVVDDGEWVTKERLTDEAVHTYKARDVWSEISKAAWVCGDPGVQFRDTINRWHTIPKTGPIVASNPCSEYLNVDDSACNLCALNLTKFFDGRQFSVDRFAHATRLFSMAQMAIVDKADYPTDKIRNNSKKLRPIGTNYGDLGALLMKMGYAYDSDEGRVVAARLASLMTGLVYKTSAGIAARVGAFQDFEKNKDDMLQVIKMHQEADRQISGRWSVVKDPLGQDVLSKSAEVWKETLDLGYKYGYSICQATLQAPLGTISFLMGMDTTGIEPAFSLVSYKSMVGGGFMKIVNGAAKAALYNLGLSESQVSDVVKFIEDNGTVEGAPHLSPSCYPVFETAMPSGPSGKYITPLGHIKMMAAIQPLITCAQSKTVNLPSTATPEEIGDIYLESWKIGVKCVALYRDGCKASQPLATKARAKEEGTIKDETKADEPTEVQQKPAEIIPKVEHTTKRRRMPDDVSGWRHKFDLDGYKGYIIVNEYEDGTPGEVFLKLGKPGSTVAGLIDGFTKLLSTGLQHGIPLERLIASFIETRFEPSGMTTNPKVRFAKSLYDYLFKLLDVHYYGGRISGLDHRLQAMSEPSSYKDEISRDVSSEIPVLASSRSVKSIDAPPCPRCGILTQRSGSCYLCTSCGSSTGCS